MRRKVKSRRHIYATECEDDPTYTFVNQDGEVELLIDDDDGVVELVNRNVHAAKHQSEKDKAAYIVGKEEPNHTQALTRRQRQKLLRQCGLHGKDCNANKTVLLSKGPVRKVEISGYLRECSY
uniref:Methylene-fatty-acyl-phospholipid synthase n=1 Tax=Lygus hesperus TaxID=30085 RepID=A0A0A9ZGB2_LYGHE